MGSPAGEGPDLTSMQQVRGLPWWGPASSSEWWYSLLQSPSPETLCKQIIACLLISVSKHLISLSSSGHGKPACSAPLHLCDPEGYGADDAWHFQMWLVNFWQNKNADTLSFASFLPSLGGVKWEGFVSLNHRLEEVYLIQAKISTLSMN